MQSSKKFDPEKQLSELFHTITDMLQHCPLLADLLSNYLRHLMWTALGDFCDGANLHRCLIEHMLHDLSLICSSSEEMMPATIQESQ